MKARIIDASTLKAVSPQALSAYARAEGWTSIEPYGDHSQVFLGSDQKTEAIIPGTSTIADYASIVSDLLSIFAKAEGRDELQVYRDVSTADKDVIRVRSPEADDDGSVQIEAGVELVRQSRELVLSAACAAWKTQASYRAGKIQQANNYMARVRLGQTEQGSFVVTLLAPVPPALQSMLPNLQEEVEEPFDRRVTMRLASSLDAAASAIEKKSLGAEISVFETAIHKGLSANLCQAAAELSGQGSGVEVSITWARTRPRPIARWSRLFTRSEGEMLGEVARIFHERAPRPDEQIEGLIVNMARDVKEFDGRVTLKAVVDGKLMSVRADLPNEDYVLASKAHLERRPIALTGTLSRIGRRWTLDKVTDVHFPEDEEPE